MDTSVSDLLILCLKVKVCLIIQIYFLLIAIEEWQNNAKIFSIAKKMK